MNVIEEFEKNARAHKQTIAEVDAQRKVVDRETKNLHVLKEKAAELSALANALAKPAREARERAKAKAIAEAEAQAGKAEA